MFIGIGRSGTTLIGALLDAHPNMAIANQQTTPKYLRPRLFSRSQIFYLLLRNSRNAVRTRRMGGYSYAVTGQWQGRFDALEVIGDKSKSAQAVTWLTSSDAISESDVERIPVYLEDFIKHPDAQLAAICNGPGVGADSDYL